MKKVFVVSAFVIGIGTGLQQSGALANKSQSSADGFSNLFMEKDGEQAIVDWNTYKADRYKRISVHLQGEVFRYLWLESNSIAFAGKYYDSYRNALQSELMLVELVKKSTDTMVLNFLSLKTDCITVLRRMPVYIDKFAYVNLYQHV